MRTTVNLDDSVLRQAQAYAPGLTKTALIEEGLRAFIKVASARALASMVGTQAPLSPPPRRKMS